MAAPGDGFWENPCGLLDDSDETDFESSYEDPTDDINEAIHSANVSSRQAVEIQKYLANKNKSIDVNALVAYDFLELPVIDFQNMDEQSAVLDMYSLLQNFAVTLEAMLDDVTDDDDYYTLLIEAKGKMLQVLCAMQKLIKVLRLEITMSVTREILPTELRNRKGSKQVMRDLTVIREYIRTTKYLTKMLVTLKDQHENQ